MKSYSEFILFENIQLADKIYFKTNKLSDVDKDIILSITNGDNYTKIISDILYYFKTNPLTHYHFKIKNNNFNSKLLDFYNQIKTYNKNTIPITDFNKNNIDNIDDIGISNLLFSLETRSKIIEKLNKLPSIAIRNLRDEIKKEKNNETFLDQLDYFMSHLSLLSNRDEKTRKKIYQKLFKNKRTLSQLIDMVEDKSSLIGGEKITQNEIFELIDEYNSDMKLMYNEKNIIVVRVESPQAIKKIGCNSLWCFTYGSGFENAYNDWNNFSTNEIVYVIINFNLEQDDTHFMNVLIKPIDFKSKNKKDNDEKMFDLENQPHQDALLYLKKLLGLKIVKKVFTFQWDD